MRLLILLTMLACPCFGAFGFNRAITVNSSQVIGGPHSSFAMRVAGTHAYLATFTNGGNVQDAQGDDIQFFSNSDCATGKLDWERELYVATTGQIEFQVRISSIDTGSVIYMCYGDASETADESNPTGVWNSAYLGRWSLKDGTTLSANDSTSGATNGTINGTTTAAAGQVDGGASTDGNTNNITLGSDPAALQATTAVTVEAWVKLDVVGTSQGTFSRIFNYPYGNGSSNPFSSYGLMVNNTNFPGAYSFWWGNTTNNYQYGLASNVDTNWHYVAATATTSGTIIYVDGSAVSGSYTGTGTQAAAISYTSGATVQLGGIDGIVDEARISNVVRSANWIQSTYNSNLDPSSFYTIGSENVLATATMYRRIIRQ